MGLTHEQLEAANKFVGATIEALGTERGVHIETAIAATARMGGTYLFRSFNFTITDAKPGQAVLSEQANERGPRLIEVMGSALDAANVPLDLSGLNAAPGNEHDPHLAFLDTQRLLEPIYEPIRTRSTLSFEEAAEAAAHAAASLIIQGSQVLDPSIAFNIAIYGFVEGSKTIPADV